jgi:hypothetical protein
MALDVERPASRRTMEWHLIGSSAFDLDNSGLKPALSG